MSFIWAVRKVTVLVSLQLHFYPMRYLRMYSFGIAENITPFCRRHASNRRRKATVATPSDESGFSLRDFQCKAFVLDPWHAFRESANFTCGLKRTFCGQSRKFWTARIMHES